MQGGFFHHRPTSLLPSGSAGRTFRLLLAGDLGFSARGRTTTLSRGRAVRQRRLVPLLVDSRARPPRHWRPPRCGTAVPSPPWRSRPWSSRGRHQVRTRNHPSRHPSYLLWSVGRQTAAADPSLPKLGWRSRAHHHQHHLPLGRSVPPLRQRRFAGDQHQR